MGLLEGTWLKRQGTEGLFLMKIKDGEDKRGGKDKQEQQGAKLWYSRSHCTEMRRQVKMDLSILISVSLPLMKQVVAL